MPQNQEEIEAKLAAYIDGELDAAGRAEIEKHLQANPQHRVLIADLTKQRELVRSLPRVNAPAEIAETLQGQLERSVLLGSGVDAGDDTSMRMSPWPHRGAIAAIVLLTAGLSFLVYKVLPSGKSSPELAVAPQSNVPATLSTEPPVGSPTGAEQPIAAVPKDRVWTEKTGPGQTPAVVGQQNNNVVGLAAPSPAARPSVGPASNEVAAVGVPGDLGAANRNDVVANAQAGNETAVVPGPGAIGNAVGGGNFSNSNNAEPLQLKAGQQELADSVKQVSAKQVSAPQCYVVVTTNDPASTDAQVRAFLIANQIRFEPRAADAQAGDRDYVRSAMEMRRQLAMGGPNASTQPTTRESAVVAPSTQPSQETVGNLVAQGAKVPTTGLSGLNRVDTTDAKSQANAEDFLRAGGQVQVSGLAGTQRTTAPSGGVIAAPTTAPSGVDRVDTTDAKSQAKGENFLGAEGQVQGSGLATTQPTTVPVGTTATAPLEAAVEVLGKAATQPVEGGETSFYCPDVTATQVQDLRSMLSLRAGQSAVSVRRLATFLPDGKVEVVNPATTQQAQAAVDQQVASQQSQQFGVGQAQGQAFLGQQVLQQGATTQPTSSPVSEGKMDLVIVMREGAGFATPQSAATTQPVAQPAVQPAGVANSPSATQPGELGPGLKVP